MMRCDPASDEIEALVPEWQCFSLCICSADVGKAARGCLALHHIEHFLRDVGCPHARNVRRKSVCDMSATGGDIKNVPVFLRGGEGHQPLQAFAERVRLAGEVVRGGFTKLLLDEGFAHRRSRSIPASRNTERALHWHAKYLHDGTSEIAGRLVIAAAQIVVAMSVAVKNKRHQASPDQQRDQHTSRYSDIP